jgi:hypothetical protein
MAGREFQALVDAILSGVKAPLDRSTARAATRAAEKAAGPITRAPRAGETLTIPGLRQVNKDVLDPVGYASTKMARPIESYAPQTIPSNIPLLPEKRVTLEDFQNQYLLPLYWDRTAGEGLLTGVGDLQLQRAYPNEGGKDFMRGAAAQADQAIVASNPAIITRLGGAASAGEEGVPVNAVMLSMGANSGDFATQNARVAADMLQQSKITAAARKALDTRMRGFDEGWPGLLSPNLDQFLLDTAPEVRKAFLSYVDSTEARKAGIPGDVAGGARYATTDPTQVTLPAGYGGMTIGRMNVGDFTIANPSVPHSSYAAQGRGEYVGGLEIPVPQSVLFPDAFSDYAQRTYFDKRSGRNLPFTDSHKTYSLKTELPLQRVNQQVVDAYGTALDQVRRLGLMDLMD